jgi:hypothetical protein
MTDNDNLEHVLYILKTFLIIPNLQKCDQKANRNESFSMELSSWELSAPWKSFYKKLRRTYSSKLNSPCNLSKQSVATI